MVRTLGPVWARFVSAANLEAAYEAARRGKRYRPDVARFELNREGNLRRLREELAAGRWRPGGYRNFLIRFPKERVISAAPFPDRVVHHAWVRIVEPFFERRFAFDSYACRVGKGTHRALARAQSFLRASKFVLQGDVRRFFPSIDHEVLRGVVARHVADERFLGVLDLVLTSGASVHRGDATPFYAPGDDLFAALRPRGLPIGNLTSQFLGNVLLDRLDRHVAASIRPRGYVRYCDDFVLFDDDRSRLLGAREEIDAVLASLRLALHADKTFVAPTHARLTFLGFRFEGTVPRLPQEALRGANARLRRQRHAWEGRRLRRTDLAHSVRSWCAHVAHGRTRALRDVLLRRHRLAWTLRVRTPTAAS